MNKDLQTLEELKKLTASLVSSKKRFLALSEKRSNMSYQDNSRKSIENAEASLNWHAMEYDKLLREVHAVCVDAGLAAPKADYEKIEYNPSAFHKYSHQPRVPLCRKN
jgi:hypothetical protein